MAGSFLGGLAGGLGGGAIGSAVVQLFLDDDRYKAQLATAQGQTATAATKMGGAFTAFKAVAGTAALAAGAALVHFGAQAVSAASDQDEALNKSNVIFGASAQAVSDFAETSAESFGISKTAALDAAAGFGNMLETAGLVPAAAADMSVSLVQLGADLASFNNISIEDALLKIKSGLAGEAEPLRTVGVLLSETRVKAEAYASGIAQTGAELTEAQKVQARYNLILGDTEKAQGDFARTSDGLANSQRTLSATMADASAEIGKQLLPAIKELMPLLITLAEDVGPILAAVIKTVAENIAPLVQPIHDLSEAARILGDESLTASDKASELGNIGLKSLDAGIKAARIFLPGMSLDVAATGDAAESAGGQFSDAAVEIQTAMDQGKHAFKDFDRAVADSGTVVRNFAGLSDTALKDFRESVITNIKGTFGTISTFDHKWELSANEFKTNADRMANQASRFTDDLKVLEKANIGEGIKKALLDEGPDAVDTFVRANKQGQSDIIADIKRSQAEFKTQRGLIEDITGALDKVPGQKDINVKVHYSYDGYNPAIPIPG